MHMGRKLTLQDFKEKVLPVHGDRYDTSLAIYRGSKTKLKIICETHGVFEITPNSFLRGRGCRECGIESKRLKLRKTTEEFIVEANHLYPEYDYSNVDYVDGHTHVEIKCFTHGVFRVKPKYFLTSSGGCQQCGLQNVKDSLSKSHTEYVSQLKDVYGDSYDYSRVDYKTANENVTIGCKEHGYFEVNANSFLRSGGCPTCSTPTLELVAQELFESMGLAYESQKRFKELGRLSFDFYLNDLKALVEMDGRQHFEAIDYFGGEENFIKQKDRDLRKDDFIKRKVYKLIRVPYDALPSPREYLKLKIQELTHTS